MPTVKFRSHGNRLPPQAIRITVPGWAGGKDPRVDGSHEQPWHCIPFSESARYGLELVYPFDDDLTVSSIDGHVRLDADWKSPPGDGLTWPPFRAFGEDLYSYQLSLDLEVPTGWAIRTEPHPRYYTDPTNTTPLAVPALIRSDWWPMTFFCIFKAPPVGVTHVFRKGEPFMSLIVVPADPELDLQPMTADEAAQREMRARRLAVSRDRLADGTKWLSSTNTVFDGTYRNMARAARARSSDPD
ncbi:hypothetical protein [Polymorphobacter megasporae]|uniref:hypothetical protein n=1 Tax=Glacieibacterium megasporae TaxID=2835787 RepID=UPI001C1E1E2A|nr:hypothetical protein [Polymorphobacter megasporae]UAJ12641.1 hypothetical protein KTC28_18970 [Polymorphobacter megasporae]